MMGNTLVAMLGGCSYKHLDAKFRTTLDTCPHAIATLLTKSTVN